MVSLLYLLSLGVRAVQDEDIWILPPVYHKSLTQPRSALASTSRGSGSGVMNGRAEPPWLCWVLLRSLSQKKLDISRWTILGKKETIDNGIKAHN